MTIDDRIMIFEHKHAELAEGCGKKKEKTMKHKYLICTALVLLTVLTAVIFNRAWLEMESTADDIAPAQSPSPAVEALGYFEKTAAAPDLLSAVPEATAGLDTEKEPAALNVAHDVRLTAYCSCEICCGYWATVRPLDENGNQIVYTSTGARCVQGETVAVDPEFIPHGSYVYVRDPHTETWREYRATDTSPAANHVDVYFSDHAAALRSGYGGWGTVYWAAEPVDPGALA